MFDIRRLLYRGLYNIWNTSEQKALQNAPISFDKAKPKTSRRCPEIRRRVFASQEESRIAQVF